MEISKKILSACDEIQAGSLFTMDQGQHIYERIIQELEKLPSPGLLVLDFLSIKYITLTCLRQILRAFHERDRRREFAGKHLAIRRQNGNSDLRDLMKVVAEEESLALLCQGLQENWEIVGNLTHALRTTLEVVQKLGKATSEEVSRELGIRLNAASNRLGQLHKLGLVVRDEESLPVTGGKRFIHVFVPSYPFQE